MRTDRMHVFHFFLLEIIFNFISITYGADIYMTNEWECVLFRVRKRYKMFYFFQIKPNICCLSGALIFLLFFFCGKSHLLEKNWIICTRNGVIWFPNLFSPILWMIKIKQKCTINVCETRRIERNKWFGRSVLMFSQLYWASGNAYVHMKT